MLLPLLSVKKGFKGDPSETIFEPLFRRFEAFKNVIIC